MRFGNLADTEVGLSNTTNDLWYDIVTNKPYHHAINCLLQVPKSRELTISNIPKESTQQTVIIENRKIPHIEYIMRKVVHLLDNQWCHCVVCTDDNFQYIEDLCGDIHTNIQVLNASRFDWIDVTNFNQNTYNNIMLSPEFWHLLCGEKILVYQQDVDINHGGIDEFLHYDYIGAPWPEHQDDNNLGVGNGGFSLRTKQAMLECLSKIKPIDLQLNDSTLKYMNGLRYLQKPLDCPPEDVYYSKTMIEYGLGKVAPRDVANRFCSEMTWVENSLGMHQPWLASNSKLYWDNIYNTYNLHTRTFSQGDATQHAGGWPCVIRNLENHGVVNMTGNIRLLDCTEQYFMWDNHPPLSVEWVGIIHITPNTPDYLDIANVKNLLKNQNYISSLPYCKGLVVMSNYLKQYIDLQNYDFPVTCIKHPVDLNVSNVYDVDSILNNERTEVIQIGQQMRYMSTLYRLNTVYNKTWLTGWKDESKMKRLLEHEMNMIGEPIGSYDVNINYLPDAVSYIDKIKNNINVINVIDASANNAVLEMISYNIPVWINKHPAVMEYLGTAYPCYYDNIVHLQAILNDPEQLRYKMIQGNKYLRGMYKHDLTHEYFAARLLELINS